MATTPVTKVTSPAALPPVAIFAGGATQSSQTGWHPIGVGSGNGCTWTHSSRDTVVLGSNTNATVTYSFLTPESAAETAYSVTRSSATVSHTANTTVPNIGLFRLDSTFANSTTTITVEANAAGGNVMVIAGA